MSEQELYMMGDDRGKDEPSAGQLIKKHDTIEAAIADYAETVNELGERARNLTDSGHPERYPIFNQCCNNILLTGAYNGPLGRTF